MPLTIAHPAAVLPFKHSKLPISALVVGSLVPDFEYAIHLAPESNFSHTAFGLFAFCLPVGMAALWIFHRVWKPPMMASFGMEMHIANMPFSFGPWSRFIILCCEILTGSLLHIMWDSFTHDYGWLVQHAEGMRRSIPMFGGLPLYLVLQYISSLLGCGSLLFIAFHHRHWTWPALSHHWPLLVIIGWMTIGGGVALGMLAAGDVSLPENLRRWPGCGLVVGATIAVLVTTFLSVTWHVRRWAARVME